MCPSALCCLFVFVRIHMVPVCTSTGSMGVVPPSCIRVQMIKSRLAWMDGCRTAREHNHTSVHK